MRDTTRRPLRLMGAAVLTAGLTAGLTAVACAGGSRPSSSPAPNGAPDSVQVGYGAQPKDKVMGAVSSMSTRDVSARRPLRIEELLRGRVAGLEILQRGNAVTFRIRGTGGMLADQEPLIVVDGIPIAADAVDSALSGLTPDNIKRVDVLKDVASTSVYGMRGAGGVIVITTKPVR